MSEIKKFVRLDQQNSESTKTPHLKYADDRLYGVSDAEPHKQEFTPEEQRFLDYLRDHDSFYDDSDFPQTHIVDIHVNRLIEYLKKAPAEYGLSHDRVNELYDLHYNQK